jgi:hypothetical protein
MIRLRSAVGLWLLVPRSAMVVFFSAPLLLVPTRARAEHHFLPETPEYEAEEHEWGEARDRVDFGFDGEGAAIVTSPRSAIGSTLTGGSGFKLRVGDQLRFPALRFTPEIGYGFEHLYTSSDVGAYSWETHRVFGGARVAFGHVVSPGFYGHLGYGWRNSGDPTISQAGGLALDAGFALDFRLVRHFTFGAHAEYATIDTQPYTPQWLALGMHGDLLFW